MRILCQHGFFKFYETKVGQISDFISVCDLSLVSKGDYFTFEKLATAPTYSLPGVSFVDSPATEIFEGEAAEVMRANGLVYNFESGLIVPIETITDVISLDESRNYFASNGLIMPGSLTAEGKRVTDYSAWFLKDGQRFKYSEVTFV